VSPFPRCDRCSSDGSRTQGLEPQRTAQDCEAAARLLKRSAILLAISMVAFTAAKFDPKLANGAALASIGVVDLALALMVAALTTQVASRFQGPWLRRLEIGRRSLANAARHHVLPVATLGSPIDELWPIDNSIDGGPAAPVSVPAPHSGEPDGRNGPGRAGPHQRKSVASTTPSRMSRSSRTACPTSQWPSFWALVLWLRSASQVLRWPVSGVSSSASIRLPASMRRAARGPAFRGGTDRQCAHASDRRDGHNSSRVFGRALRRARHDQQWTIPAFEFSCSGLFRIRCEYLEHLAASTRIPCARLPWLDSSARFKTFRIVWTSILPRAGLGHFGNSVQCGPRGTDGRQRRADRRLPQGAKHSLPPAIHVGMLLWVVNRLRF